MHPWNPGKIETTKDTHVLHKPQKTNKVGNSQTFDTENTLSKETVNMTEETYARKMLPFLEREGQGDGN